LHRRGITRKPVDTLRIQSILLHMFNTFSNKLRHILATGFCEILQITTKDDFFRWQQFFLCLVDFEIPNSFEEIVQSSLDRLFVRLFCIIIVVFLIRIGTLALTLLFGQLFTFLALSILLHGQMILHK
jgi:hypothetical protein